MWFKNLAIFRLPNRFDRSTLELQPLLEARQLQPCAASDVQSIGWVSPCSEDLLSHRVNGFTLLALGVEQKLLPASVVKQFAADRAAVIEENEGRRVGRKEMRELRENATMELLPRAFVRRRATFGYLDSMNGWLVIDAASPSKAEEFLEHLRKTFEGIPVRLLQVHQSPSAAMTSWVADGEAPVGFTLDQDLYLRSAENAEVRYVRHSLEGEDIREQIAAGKVATKLALTWSDRISFVLTDALQIKRLSFLDILKEQGDGQAENEAERFDIDFALMTGEVARLLDDLGDALGGVMLEPAK